MPEEDPFHTLPVPKKEFAIDAATNLGENKAKYQATAEHIRKRFQILADGTRTACKILEDRGQSERDGFPLTDNWRIRWSQEESNREVEYQVRYSKKGVYDLKTLDVRFKEAADSKPHTTIHADFARGVVESLGFELVNYGGPYKQRGTESWSKLNNLIVDMPGFKNFFTKYGIDKLIEGWNGLQERKEISLQVVVESPNQPRMQVTSSVPITVFELSPVEISFNYRNQESEQKVDGLTREVDQHGRNLNLPDGLTNLAMKKMPFEELVAIVSDLVQLTGVTEIRSPSKL